MKKLKMLLVMMALSSPVMGQDYYAPTDKEKEAVARFPFGDLEKPVIYTKPNGDKYIKYTLPEILTGEKNTIIADAVDLPQFDNQPNTVQMFVTANAVLTCMGEDSNPGCMVTHRNLNFSPAKSEAAVNAAFSDKLARQDALSVVRDFQSLEHSGNQPIGFIGALKDRPSDANKPAQGTMDTKYDNPDPRKKGIVWARITWNGNEASYKFSESHAALNSGAQGKLSQIKFHGNRAVGRWQAGGSEGWFEFNFNKERTRFEGYYGFGSNGSPRAGRWVSDSVN